MLEETNGGSMDERGELPAKTPMNNALGGGEGKADVALVETSVPDVYLATGNLSVLGTHVVPLTFDAGVTRSKVKDAAAMAVGGANVAAQVVNGLNMARGLV